jgi:hypothetical protein
VCNFSPSPKATVTRLLLVFENKRLRKIFGLLMYGVSGQVRTLCNEGLGDSVPFAGYVVFLRQRNQGYGGTQCG